VSVGYLSLRRAANKSNIGGQKEMRGGRKLRGFAKKARGRPTYLQREKEEE